jgi:hypothetical protein
MSGSLVETAAWLTMRKVSLVRHNCRSIKVNAATRCRTASLGGESGALWMVLGWAAGQPGRLGRSRLTQSRWSQLRLLGLRWARSRTRRQSLFGLLVEPGYRRCTWPTCNAMGQGPLAGTRRWQVDATSISIRPVAGCWHAAHPRRRRRPSASRRLKQQPVLDRPAGEGAEALRAKLARLRDPRVLGREDGRRDQR